MNNECDKFIIMKYISISKKQISNTGNYNDKLKNATEE